MCGIFCVYHYGRGDVDSFLPKASKCSELLRHRGGDAHGMIIKKNTILCHERLAIFGIHSGAQPIVSSDGNMVLAVNGEIYNHNALQEKYCSKEKFVSDSDCEIIMHLYPIFDVDTPTKLDGKFSFALYDASNDRMIAARDPIGVTTFYIGRDSQDPSSVYFASELKSLQDVCDEIELFPPGHVFDSKSNKMLRYYNPSWFGSSKIPTTPVDYSLLRSTLENAVRKRLMTEVPYGVLLSGGLDSSLIASIAVRENNRLISMKERHEAESQLEPDELRRLTSKRLKSFSIGLEGSPDLIAAEKAAKFLNTDHHSFTFTLEEGLEALEKVIYHLETYDVTTIRASTPMFLLSKKIHELGVKMVLSGEGSDEIFGGYLYFADAPSAQEFHDESVRRVKNLHYFDNLRANKSTMAWSLEARVPFLDKSFLEVALNVDPKEKLISSSRMEKYILRKAFTVKKGEEPFLPDEILWRQKEQFSDGVGYGWIDILKDTAERKITDEMLANLPKGWNEGASLTKEAYYYRRIFDELFKPHCASTVLRWTPKQEWGCSSDPSGRSQKTHTHFYGQEEGLK